MDGKEGACGDGHVHGGGPTINKHMRDAYFLYSYCIYGRK